MLGAVWPMKMGMAHSFLQRIQTWGVKVKSYKASVHLTNVSNTRDVHMWDAPLPPAHRPWPEVEHKEGTQNQLS